MFCDLSNLLKACLLLAWAWLAFFPAIGTSSPAKGRPATAPASQQDAASDEGSRQEQLRGSITPERAWWDVKHYDLSIEVFPETKSIRGKNRVTFRTLAAGQKMQMDLQQPLEMTKVTFQEQQLNFTREGNVYWILFPAILAEDQEAWIDVEYQGEPVVSKNPPWSGGISWQTDEKGQPFIATSCQGIGASIWWPNKDHGSDEPDRGMALHITVPETLTAVSNGRLKDTSHHTESGTRTFHWEVTNPINNYGVNMNIGNYLHFSDVYEGEFGKLDLDYWVLEHQKEIALKHFKEAPRTIAAFEHWFGKYPFYEDSYKLVVVPYLGMEHQSSVTYGNGFQNGYRGRDLSGTGVGLKFDFIIVHESGHEWFGNNISMKDSADMWIHEGFTNYSENLFVEYHFTKEEAEDYVIGCRKLIRNDSPIIAQYNLNRSGSGDMYYKGGNMLHTLRHTLNDDQKWREILRGLNQEFWHQTVTTQQVEAYLSQQVGRDLGPFFDQYLRSAEIPKLIYTIDGSTLEYHWENVVEGFTMPIRVEVNDATLWLTPTAQVQTLTAPAAIKTFGVDRNFYIESAASSRHTALAPK